MSCGFYYCNLHWHCDRADRPGADARQDIRILCVFLTTYYCPFGDAALTCFIFKKELTFKQTIVRKVLHLLILEALLTLLAWLNRNVSTLGETLLFMAMVFVIYLAVALISLWLQNKDAKQINDGLKALQNRK